LRSHIIPDTTIQTFAELGLSLYQADVFLALEQLGTSTAKEISDASDVPRQKVYEALDALIKIGLVNKELSKPTKFRAESLKDATTYLLKRKMNLYRELRVKADRVIHEHNLKHRQNSQTTGSACAKLELTPQKDAIIQCIRRSIDNSEANIDMVTSWKRFSKIRIFSDELARAGKRGVIMRVVVERPENYNQLNEIIKSIEMPHSSYRTIGSKPSAITYLYDEKRTLIFTEPGTGLEDSPAISTSNLSLVELSKTYFEKMWTESKPFTGTLNIKKSHRLVGYS
jgi:sugar-specific transcriptional regulator TrmB